ncbi:MAG: hypothetical protein RL198_176 [Actinomycetota bacterium]
MYGALWRALPGKRLAKTLQLVLLVVAVLAALHFFVFPAVDQWIGVVDSRMET